MTEKLYEKDSHIKEFTARVVSCTETGGGFAAVFDRTAFFPEGGGQESDRGTAGGAKVLDVQEENGEILHYLDAPLTPGETAECRLDWERRFRNMQNHSGEHIISGIVHKLYGLDNVGFHLGNEMTLDFNGELNREQLLRVERLANEAVYKNARFTAWYPPADELKTLSYRSKLELQSNVRLVEIEGFDLCACCAPHVKSAAEIGLIKILDFFRNKGGVRVFAKCGTDALDDYNVKYRSEQEISELLSAKQYETAVAVKKLYERSGELKAEISVLKKRLIAEMAAGFRPEGNVTALFEDGLDIKELQLFADALYKSAGGIRAVFSGAENGFAFAVCGDESELERFFGFFKAEFEVRGGGRNGIRQGTVNAAETAIKAYFENKALN